MYSKVFHNNKFRADIIITNDEKIYGKVIDLELNEEYTNIRANISGCFVNEIKEEYKSILLDIKNNCFKDTLFIMEQSNRISDKIFDKYKVKPEFLWDNDPYSAVFRNSNSNKWFGIIMYIDEYKLTKDIHNNVEIINVKLDENVIKELLKKKGFYKAYHMNSKYWISILLNNTISDEDILNFLDDSYINTNK